MIRFKLQEALEDRGKTMYWLAKETGVRPNTISQWVNNEVLEDDKKVKSIILETLDKFCVALDCDISDLIEFVRDTKRKK